MSEYIEIGKITNTHGIKGEVKILSTFKEKELVFKPNFKLYLTPLYKEFEINTYRTHQKYDMVTFKGITNINEILAYKGVGVYIKRSDLNLGSNEYLMEDLIGYKVYDGNEFIGIVEDLLESNCVLLKVKKEKYFYIPFISEYIVDIIVADKKIITKNGKELII